MAYVLTSPRPAGPYFPAGRARPKHREHPVTDPTPREFVQRMIELGITDARLDDAGGRCLIPHGTLPDGTGVLVANSDGWLGNPDEPMTATRYPLIVAGRYMPATATGSNDLPFNEPIDFSEASTPEGTLNQIALWISQPWTAPEAPDQPTDDQIAAAVRVLVADFLASQADGRNARTCYPVIDGIQITATHAERSTRVRH